MDLILVTNKGWELKIHSTKDQKKMQNIRINRWDFALIVKIFYSPTVCRKRKWRNPKKKKEGKLTA